MGAILIVDGYNVIYDWPVLNRLKDESLHHARDRLAEMLASYGAFTENEVLIVYDAHHSPGVHAVEEDHGGVTVVYTGEAQTADSYIERLAYSLVRQGKTVYVVTSDWAEQLAILGAGAYRISAGELYRDIETNAKVQQKKYAENPLTRQRNEVATRVDGKVMKKLDEMRRRR